MKIKTTLDVTRIGITITETGLCREAGYGGFGRYGEHAVGKAVDVIGPAGLIHYRIISVGTRIHTCSGGGSNFVHADAVAEIAEHDAG